MKRREFIALIGCAAAWPLTATAQQVTLPVVGFLSGRSLSSDAHLVRAFRNGLNEAGYVEGQNAVIKFRWAEGKPDKLPELAADLVAHKVAVVFMGAADVGVHKIKAALPEIPVVFATGGDPVALGIAASLARPGGNFTGMTVLSASLWPKRLALLRELIGRTDLIAVLINPANDTAAQATKDVEAAAKDIGQRITLLNAKSETEFDTAFTTISSERANALVVPDDAVFINGRKKLIALASQHALPTIYGRREFPTDGGLVSYGASVTDQYRQCGLYVGRILGGAKPTDLPFLQPTKFELVINVRAAKTLGLKVPETLVVAADELIE
ncbi:MAG TPA: ABC transporter substrate-binding protein [Pseudolabrys sp.]|nr:ABC transporter substrate-binding protein [Pseudolabrys sp.]